MLFPRDLSWNLKKIQRENLNFDQQLTSNSLLQFAPPSCECAVEWVVTHSFQRKETYFGLTATLSSLHVRSLFLLPAGTLFLQKSQSLSEPSEDRTAIMMMRLKYYGIMDDTGSSVERFNMFLEPQTRTLSTVFFIWWTIIQMAKMGILRAAATCVKLPERSTGCTQICGFLLC